ncbi:MAG TPA: AI-2E family transporter, partial [Vicinamibacterales bacterium]|nr:AI-2E family transporter [Vicinamibacterales bacterium]
MPDGAELPGAPPVPAAGAPELKSLLVVVVSVVVVAALYIGKDVLVPIVLAMMLSFVLTPLVDLVQRTGVSRAPSVIFTVLLAFCVIVLGGVLMARQASALAADAPRYATAIDRKVQSVQMFTTSHLMLLTRLFARGEGATPTANRSGASSPAGNNLADANAAREQPVPVKIAPASGASVVFGTILAPVVGPMETAVIVVVIAIFMLVEREDLRDRFIRLAGSEDLQRTTVAMNDAGARLSRYFVSQLAVNATFGTVIGVGLWT